MVHDNRIDVVRCIANYTIIILHAGAAFQYCNPEIIEYKFWTYICWDICYAALPALFLISGYLLFQKYTLISYPKKLIRRGKRLVAPYFAWNLSFVVFYLVMGHIIPRLNARVTSFEIDTIQGILNKTCSLYTHPIDGPLWFLRTLFIFALCSPILYYFLRSKRGRWIGLGIIIFAYPICYYFKVLPNLQMTYPLYALLTFYLGGIFAFTKNLEGRFVWFKSNLWIISCVFGICLLGYVVWLNESFASSSTALIDDLGKLAITPLIFIIVNHLNIEKISVNKIYLYLKDMSFFAYAGHFLFCSMIMHTVAPFLGFMTTGKFTVLVFIFCGIGVPVMAGIYWFGKKYLPHIMKLYDGTL